MADKIRAVVVGGGWGRNHALAYQQHPDAELLGIIGRVGSERTRRLAQEMQVPVYLGLAETLAKPAAAYERYADERGQRAVSVALGLRVGWGLKRLFRRTLPVHRSSPAARWPCSSAVSRFIDAIRDGQPVPVPGEDGLNRLLIERALLQSAGENRPVRVTSDE
jgi:predicted dehydrogenase